MIGAGCRCCGAALPPRQREVCVVIGASCRCCRSAAALHCLRGTGSPACDWRRAAAAAALLSGGGNVRKRRRSVRKRLPVPALRCCGGAAAWGWELGGRCCVHGAGAHPLGGVGAAARVGRGAARTRASGAARPVRARQCLSGEAATSGTPRGPGAARAGRPCRSARRCCWRARQARAQRPCARAAAWEAPRARPRPWAARAAIAARRATMTWWSCPQHELRRREQYLSSSSGLPSCSRLSSSSRGERRPLPSLARARRRRAVV